MYLYCMYVSFDLLVRIPGNLMIIVMVMTTMLDWIMMEMISTNPPLKGQWVHICLAGNNNATEFTLFHINFMLSVQQCVSGSIYSTTSTVSLPV